MTRAATLAALAAGLLGCDTRGLEGHACIVSGGLLTPSYTCNPGLVCNTVTNTCERPHQGAAGSPCESDQVCRQELWCPPGLDAGCAERLSEGRPCPSGVGCAEGLRCEKVDGGTACVR